LSDGSRISLDGDLVALVAISIHVPRQPRRRDRCGSNPQRWPGLPADSPEEKNFAPSVKPRTTCLSSPTCWSAANIAPVKREAVEMDLGNGWVVEMTWPEGQTQGGPRELVVRPADPEACPAGGLSSTVLRRINFRDASARLHRQLAIGQIRQKVRDKYEAKRLERIRDELSKGISPEYLALLSSLYVNRVKRGEAKPIEAIAEDLGKGVQTIRGHLWKARNEGLLTGRSPGRKGGELTKNASQILERVVPGAPRP
jgi:hypothetical protein